MRSSNTSPSPSHKVWATQLVPFKVSKIAIAITAVASILATNPLYAADDKLVADLQAEIANLKRALESSQKELAAQKNAQPSTGISSAETPTTSEAAETAKVDETKSLDTVVVRNPTRLALIHDVPISQSVISGTELNRELALDLNAITKRGANISFNQNNTRGASLSIRGLGKGRSFQETQDPSVGISADGVSYGLTQLANFDFYDVDSVDVIRGPQGTQGGKGGSTGLVTINYKKPSFTPTADFQLTYGERETVIAKSNLGGAIIDDLLAWRGSFIVDKARGYYDSSYDSNFSFYNKDRVSGRTQFLLTPTENLSARFSVDIEPRAPQLQNGLTRFVYQPQRYANGTVVDTTGASARVKLARDAFVGRSFSSGSYASLSGAYDYNTYLSSHLLQNENQGQTVSNSGASAEVNWNLGKVLVTSITSWRKTTFDAHNDEGTPFDISKNGGGGVFYNQYSQELKFTSTEKGFIDYTGGIFSFKTTDNIVSKAGWGADAGNWFANNSQYNLLTNPTLPANNPASATAIASDSVGGRLLLKDSLQDALTRGVTRVETFSNAIYGNIKWNLTDDFNVTTGLRITNENRSTEDTKLLLSNGVGAALNPVSVRTATGIVNTGGFSSNATTGVLTGLNSAQQLALADSVAKKYFGVNSTNVPGAAYNSLSDSQKRQIAATKSLRAGQIGALSSGVTTNYDDNLITSVISPSYKFNENFTGYTTWQHGEKSGSALNNNFVGTNVKPEKTDAFEIGLKSILLNKTLTLNADLFLMNIKDYQATVRTLDTFQTAVNQEPGNSKLPAYLIVQGNVPKVRTKGVEFDGAYTGIADTTVRFSGAYTDARYVKFDKAAFPDELAYLSSATNPYYNQSGLTLPGAAKFTFNVGAEYRKPVLGDKLFHTSFNTAYTTRYNNTDTLSSYGWIAAHSLTDASIGISTKNNFDLTLVAKNLFDDRSHEKAWASYSPDPYPRWVGITFSSKL